jgi:hypothetical protein
MSLRFKRRAMRQGVSISGYLPTSLLRRSGVVEIITTGWLSCDRR